MRASESVVAVYGNYEQARTGVDALRQAGVPLKHISVVTHDVAAETDYELQQALQAGDETTNNAAVGAGIGGTVGLVAGIAAFSVVGAGLLFVAGPIGAGLTGMIVGGFLGAMSGWGVHTDHVRQYEERVRQGKTLVAAYGDPEEMLRAQRALQQTFPEEVALHARAGDESPEVDDRPTKPR